MSSPFTSHAHHVWPLSVVTATFSFSLLQKRTLGRKGSDSSTSAQASAARGCGRAEEGAGQDHHAGGQWTEAPGDGRRGAVAVQGHASAGSETLQGQPGGRWAQRHPSGPRRRPGRGRRTPRAGRTAAQWPRVRLGREARRCPRPPWLSSVTIQGDDGRGSPLAGSGRSVRPGDPPLVAGPGTTRDPGAPTGSGCEGGSSHGSAVPTHEPHSSTPASSPATLIQAPSLAQRCPPSARECLPGLGAAATAQSLD